MKIQTPSLRGLFVSKKAIIPLLLLSFCVSQLHSQGNAFGVEWSINMGYQQHDKRFWGRKSDQGDWGTSYFSSSLMVSLMKKRKWEWMMGLGFALEENTYRQPFDHCFDRPGEPCTKILVFLGKYSIFMLQTPLRLRYRLTPRFGLQADMYTQFYFYKRATNGNIAVSQFKTGYYSSEFVPGFYLSGDRFRFSLGYRVAQFKAIDRVYLYGNNFLSAHPGYLDQAGDTFNPIKFVAGMSYRLGK